MAKVTLTIDTEDADKILNALASLPFRAVAKLIGGISEQIRKQLSETPPVAAEEAKE